MRRGPYLAWLQDIPLWVSCVCSEAHILHICKIFPSERSLCSEARTLHICKIFPSGRYCPVWGLRRPIPCIPARYSPLGALFLFVWAQRPISCIYARYSPLGVFCLPRLVSCAPARYSPLEFPLWVAVRYSPLGALCVLRGSRIACLQDIPLWVSCVCPEAHILYRRIVFSMYSQVRKPTFLVQTELILSLDRSFPT
jgi:hypothetical protein